MRTLYLTCYQCSGSTSIDSFVYDSFVKKVIQKKNYIALTHLCKKRCLKKPCSFRSVIKSKSMGTQVSMNEKVPDLLLLEGEVDSVISSAETEVSTSDLATNIDISDPDIYLI